MAGLYPDVPGRRMAYDIDGSVVVACNISAGTLAVLSEAQVLSLNSESVTTNYQFGTNTNQQGRLVIIFPEPRDIVGYGVAAGVTPGTLQTSEDTTNGLDGLWDDHGGWTKVAGSHAMGLRSDIAEPDPVLTGVKAIGFTFTAGSSASSRQFNALHLYGDPTGATDRLRFWHPIDDEEVSGAYFDWGDRIQGFPHEDREFRIKNDSSLLAQDITISASAPTDATPSLIDQYSFDAGGGFAPTVVIGSLEPGEVSGLVTVRKAWPSNAALSVQTARIIADVNMVPVED